MATLKRIRKLANLPYAQRVGTLESMLEKIKTASVPEKFSQDFVSTKLAMKGGTPRSIIPFIKKMGLVSSDGTPTDRYREFRNPRKSGAAIAHSMREVYAPLFEMNEYANELTQTELRGLIVEATGAEPTARTVDLTVSTFSALNKLADFQAPEIDVTDNARLSPATVEPNSTIPIHSEKSRPHRAPSEGINLSYTLNLNLPATTDIEVFNAIFKSLKQHLLQS